MMDTQKIEAKRLRELARDILQSANMADRITQSIKREQESAHLLLAKADQLDPLQPTPAPPSQNKPRNWGTREEQMAKAMAAIEYQFSPKFAKQRNADKAARLVAGKS